MSDDELTRAIAEALGCEESSFYGVGVCVAHGPGWPCRKAEHVAAALAPLIEARVREAEAVAWQEGYDAWPSAAGKAGNHYRYGHPPTGGVDA